MELTITNVRNLPNISANRDFTVSHKTYEGFVRDLATNGEGTGSGDYLPMLETIKMTNDQNYQNFLHSLKNSLETVI